MTYRIDEIPATQPPMVRLEEAENEDAWIAADANALVPLVEATDEEVREAIEEMEENHEG